MGRIWLDIHFGYVVEELLIPYVVPVHVEPCEGGKKNGRELPDIYRYIQMTRSPHGNSEDTIPYWVFPMYQCFKFNIE